MLCCTSKLAHRITKRHLEACFFIVSWNFPVTQLWEQVGAQRASGPSMNQTRVRGSLWGGQCGAVWFFDVACVKTFKIQHCDSSGENCDICHICENCREKGTGMVGVQTVVYMRCAANQRNVVRQANYTLKAINGAGHDTIT